jgi:predicted RNase H-like HicB family nuclease
VAQFVGILDGARDVWGVRIPDFPGCHGGGATPEEALADAMSALREVAAHYVDNGMKVPLPRSMDQVRRDKAAGYDPVRESMVLVPLVLDKARPVKANISVDAGTLEAIDEEADRRGLTRSSFLASAAMDKIGLYAKEKRYVGEKRTTSRSSKGTKLYAIRDKEGKFKDIQTYKRAHSQDIKRKTTKKVK